MASNACFRFMLKTPDGYLTPSGITKDINDKRIIVLSIFEAGGLLGSKEVQVESFLKKTTANLNFAASDCEVIYYSCPLDRYYSCSDCIARTDCEFWTKRETCKFN